MYLRVNRLWIGISVGCTQRGLILVRFRALIYVTRCSYLVHRLIFDHRFCYDHATSDGTRFQTKSKLGFYGIEIDKITSACPSYFPLGKTLRNYMQKRSVWIVRTCSSRWPKILRRAPRHSSDKMSLFFFVEILAKLGWRPLFSPTFTKGRKSWFRSWLVTCNSIIKLRERLVVVTSLAQQFTSFVLLDVLHQGHLHVLDRSLPILAVVRLCASVVHNLEKKRLVSSLQLIQCSDTRLNSDCKTQGSRVLVDLHRGRGTR